MTDARIIVFAKAPLPGRVKTRLCPLLQAEQAAALHIRMVRHALDIANVAAPGHVELHGSPTLDHAFFADCARRYGVVLRAQVEGDVGDRMAHALRHATRDAPLLLIGTDCPSRTADDLREALAALAGGTDAVLGPVEDGGYSLIGLSRFEPAVFSGIDWSSDRVTRQTIHQLEAADLRYRLLPTRWDVDRPADLVRLQQSFPEWFDGIPLAQPIAC